ncbi:hypothetical protein J7J18_04845 [bacterium]|nr:hypothetical protein [bacterium]
MRCVRCRRKKRKTIDEIIQEALENAPTIHSYTIKQLSEITGIPWTTTRWHIERVGNDEFRRAKYRLKRRKKKRK